jgi:hypothetical protein
LTARFGAFDDERFDERRFERHLEATLLGRCRRVGIGSERYKRGSSRETILPRLRRH